MERFGSLLRHPLVLLVAGGLFTAVLVPQVTRQWQDRQSEHEIKRSLLEEISSSATTAVRQANSLVTACQRPPPQRRPRSAAAPVCAPFPPAAQLRAAGGAPGEGVPEIYSVLKNSWLIRRAAARSRINTYFPDLYSCWYSYERALADYIGLVTQYPNTKRVRVAALSGYVDGDLENVYGAATREVTCASVDDLPPNVQTRFAELQSKMRWGALAFPTWHPRFKQEYAKLGELLEIAMERMIITIVRADAEGFSHGVDLPLI